MKKLDRWSVLSFKNGLRLHEDAISMHEQQSYPTALLLSALSLEELGKSLALEHYVWTSAIHGQPPPDFEKGFIDLLYNHRWKQGSFARFGYGPPVICRKAIQSIYNGDLEKLKQAATYVGLPRYGKKLNYKGRLVTPFNINKSKAADHITIVNDFVVLLAAGCIKGTSSMDLVGLEALFNHALVNKLHKRWPRMSREAKKQFTQIMKHDDASLEDRGLTTPSTRRARAARR